LSEIIAVIDGPTVSCSIHYHRGASHPQTRLCHWECWSRQTIYVAYILQRVD